MGIRKQMRPGTVVSVRLNPADCMAVVDVLKIIGYPMHNLSFAHATKIAFASMAESMRQNQIIPRRLGYEYLEMMEPFKEDLNGRRAAKLNQTKLDDMAGSKFQPAPIVPVTPQLAAAKRLMEELAMRKENDPANWTEQDEEKWLEVCGLLYDQ